MAKQSILTDHKRDRKKLIPPILAFMGENYSPYSWARQIVPEVLWIALLHQSLGLKKAVPFALMMVSEADRLCTAEPKPNFSKASSYGILTEEQKASFVKCIAKDPDFHSAIDALSPLFLLTPVSPMNFLKSDKLKLKKETAVEVMHDLLPKMYSRGSRDSVLCIATSICAAVRQQKFQMATHLFDKFNRDMIAIEDYPRTEDSKAAAASLRAMAPMLLINQEGQGRERLYDWLEQFWAQVGSFGSCQLPFDIEYETEPEGREFGRILVRYRNSARRELYERLNNWKLDLQKIELQEVVGALLARQVTLVSDLAAAPTIWTPHAAPLFLRAMADVHIILAWIFGNPSERTKKFFEDGLGAVKLELAHRKAEYEKSDDQDLRMKQIIEYWENWLSSQRMADLVEVNLGNWSGITTRKMAEDAGCIDFYNYVYQPFSNAVDSSWPHVSDKNMVYCLNPTHLNHRLAVSFDVEPEIFWLDLAAKYLEKTFKLFDTQFKISNSSPSAYQELLESLTKPTDSET